MDGVTTRQIRIACNGSVIQTRPFPDRDCSAEEATRVVAPIMNDIRELQQHGRVTVWVDEAGSNVAHLIGGAP